MMKSDKPELLAPAGSKEALIAAVEGGADAVYIGGASYSARAFANNFSDEDIKWAVDYCHLRRVKVYVAVNTLVSDREFPQLAEFIAFVYNIGADALIIQDSGVALLAREIAPELSLHVSTQATVIDTEGALFYKSLGFSRVVVARELSKEKIALIADKSGMEIEMFVHGAICVCYSGQCLMSSHIGGRSGNRGKCAQPCRLLYGMDGKEGYLLSPKDMCLIGHIDEIRSLGVKSLKIEGRMKGQEYVAETVGIYRKYLDSGIPVSKDDYNRLERIFYRGGFTDAYFTDGKGADMFCHTKPDNPYKMQSGGNVPYKLERKFKVSFECVARLGKPLCITICDDLGNKVQAEGDVPCEAAINRPMTYERLQQQLSKLGDTVFFLDKLYAEIDDNISVPVSEINSVRRKAVSLLEQESINRHRRDGNHNYKFETCSRRPTEELKISVQVSNEQQLKALKESDFDTLYIPLSMAVKGECFADKTVTVLPRITPENLKEQLKKLKVKKALMTNIGQYNILKESGFEIYVDHTINIFNNYSAKYFSDASVITPSTELMLAQIKALGCDVPIEVIAYGRLPLMITENCIVKSSVGCKGGGVLKDRTGAEFPVVCLDGCRNEILNSKPVVMSDKLGDIKKSGINSIRLVFTTEKPRECAEILNSYKDEINIFKEYTRGKSYKGV